MAAGPGQGPGQGPALELCPHCHRPFKRLRAHLPHCKAAPRPPPAANASPRLDPGGATGTGAAAPKPRPASAAKPGSAQRSSVRPSPGRAPAAEPGPGPAAPGSGSGSVRSGPARRSPTHPDPANPDPVHPGPASPGPASPRPAHPSPADPSPARPGPARGSERQPREGPGRAVEPAVQDVAAALDLHPEEVEDVPERMESGVKVVIERHRARVVREKVPKGRAGAAEGTHPGRAAHTQRGKTAPKPAPGEPRSSKGGKIGLKATKALPESPEGRNGPGEVVQQEGTAKPAAEQEQQREAGVGWNAPVSALHPKNLHLAGAVGGHSQGTSKDELSSLERLGDSREQMAPGTGRAPGLALQQPWLCSSKAQPSVRSTWAGATGLEWFPDLYPECDGLRMLQGKRFQDVEITGKTLVGSFPEGPRGPLSERPLMEVRLGELPTWISTCDFSPQGLLGAVQKAWNSYYAKYINVRRGGHAGISMLLAGYCLLSYSWNYQHLKRYRWRKYH